MKTLAQDQEAALKSATSALRNALRYLRNTTEFQLEDQVNNALIDLTAAFGPTTVNNEAQI